MKAKVGSNFDEYGVTTAPRWGFSRYGSDPERIEKQYERNCGEVETIAKQRREDTTPLEKLDSWKATIFRKLLASKGK